MLKSRAPWNIIDLTGRPGKQVGAKAPPETRPRAKGGKMRIVHFTTSPAMTKVLICLPFLAMLLAVLAAPLSALAADARVIYDGRLTLKPAPLSPSETVLFKDRILPAARTAWREEGDDGVCLKDSKPDPVDVTQGSFTRTGADQKAILYAYCMTGHNMALNGIAIIEAGQVVIHVIYSGAWVNGIGALPDLSGNGLSRLVIATGGTNTGITWKSISLLGLNGRAVEKFGTMAVFSDACGTGKAGCRAEASRLSVKVGKRPLFFRETFTRKGAGDGPGGWKKSEAPGQVSLESDETEYRIISK